MRSCFRLKKIYRPWIIISSLYFWIILINEYILYEWCFMKWNNNYNRNVPSALNGINILFVADPQLIGLENEKRLFENVIRWDADRFLSRGFARAVRFTQPDVVVFLGDIFDEGELASDTQFQTYMERFKSIYTSTIPVQTKVIIVPGDNDVGGEGMTPKLKSLIERFNKEFDQAYPSMNVLGNVNLIASDVSNRVDFEQLKSYLSSNNRELKSRHNILLSHNSYDMNKATLSQLGISAIITAHIHLSRVQVCTNCRPISSHVGRSLENFDTIEFPLRNARRDLLEITVPTCSYRMGVPYPGFGFMTVKKDGSLTYVVLWLHYRFQCLILYLVAFIPLSLFVVYTLLKRI